MFGKVSNHNRHGFFRFVSIALSVVMIALLAVGCTPKNEQVVENGLSAYEIAVQYGYEGTIEEWLDSLHGKSAYDIAVEAGYSGTQEQWITAVNAAASAPGAGIASAKFNAMGELILVLSDGSELNVGKAVGAAGKDGTNGKDGADGKNGTNGADGKDGIGISGASINADGQLVITYSNGKTVNLDKEHDLDDIRVMLRYIVKSRAKIVEEKRDDVLVFDTEKAIEYDNIRKALVDYIEHSNAAKKFLDDNWTDLMSAK